MYSSFYTWEENLNKRRARLFEPGSGMFGLPRLDERYAWISMIERLAQGDITKFDDVYQMSVEESYYLLEYWKVRDEWTDDCNKIIAAKQK